MINIDLKKDLELFIETSSKMGYEQNGAFPSEIYLLFCLHKQLKNNLFIESGIDNGNSTKILLQFIDEPYLGFDINGNCNGAKIKKDNFQFYNKEASQIENYITDNSDKSISLFIDGPKGLEAANLKNKFLNYNNVTFVAIHDTYDGLENENLFRIFETKNNHFYALEFFEKINKTNHLNNIYSMINYNNKTYAETFPTGPGISVYSKKDLKFIY